MTRAPSTRSAILAELAILSILGAGALLPSCTTTAGTGLTVLWQQRKHTLNTRQGCLEDPAVIREADLALLLIAREASTRGLLPYERAAELVRKPGVCLIAQPEQCCLGAYCVPNGDRAGCSAEGWAWVSERWQGAQRDWSSDLLHELVHVVAYAASSVYPPDHSGPWSEVERAAQLQRAALRKESR